MALFAIVGLAAMPGCRRFAERPFAAPTVPIEVPNPLSVPMYDRELVMDQISDELDDYFRIRKEERVRLVDDVLTEGWIETHPQIGGTLLEPWKRDSTPGFEKLHATLQTVRRFAKVRVIPAENRYLIDVKVYKELEDRKFPLGTAVTGQPTRHDNALDIDDDFVMPERNEGWIPLGRDLSLEQLILRNIQSRIDKNCAADGGF